MSESTMPRRVSSWGNQSIPQPKLQGGNATFFVIVEAISLHLAVLADLDSKPWLGFPFEVAHSSTLFAA